MNRFMRIVGVISVATTLASITHSAEMDKAVVARLLDGFPTSDQIEDAHKKLSATVPTTADERKAALELLALIKERIPKLRDLFTDGTSVFDYPGLLACGRCIFINKSRKDIRIETRFYRLFLGDSDAEEFKHPMMLIIDFDQKGTIIKVGVPGKATL